MAAVWNNENKPETLQAILDSTALVNAQLLLFTTITSITDATPFSTFTGNEVSFTGYSRQNVEGWSFPSMSGHRAVSVSEIITFLNSGGSPSPTITGWALIYPDSSHVIVADLYSTPFSIAAGGAYTTALVLTFRGEVDHTP